MADTKLTALTLRDRFTIDPTDAAMVVDISDTTMDASGTNVEMALQEFVAAGAIGVLGVSQSSDSGLLRWSW